MAANLALAWKSDDLANNPHFVAQVTTGRNAGTYGVWVQVQGNSARPVGSGRGINSLDAAISYAKRANMLMKCGRDD